MAKKYQFSGSALFLNELKDWFHALFPSSQEAAILGNKSSLTGIAVILTIVGIIVSLFFSYEPYHGMIPEEVVSPSWTIFWTVLISITIAVSVTVFSALFWEHVLSIYYRLERLVLIFLVLVIVGGVSVAYFDYTMMNNEGVRMFSHQVGGDLEVADTNNPYKHDQDQWEKKALLAEVPLTWCACKGKRGQNAQVKKVDGLWAHVCPKGYSLSVAKKPNKYNKGFFTTAQASITKAKNMAEHYAGLGSDHLEMKAAKTKQHNADVTEKTETARAVSDNITTYIYIFNFLLAGIIAWGKVGVEKFKLQGVNIFAPKPEEEQVIYRLRKWFNKRFMTSEEYEPAMPNARSSVGFDFGSEQHSPSPVVASADKKVSAKVNFTIEDERKKMLDYNMGDPRRRKVAETIRKHQLMTVEQLRDLSGFGPTVVKKIIRFEKALGNLPERVKAYEE